MHASSSFDSVEKAQELRGLSCTINQASFSGQRIGGQASFRFLIFSRQKPLTKTRPAPFSGKWTKVFRFGGRRHLQFPFQVLTLSQIEICPVPKMFSFARKWLDLFANEEELKRWAALISPSCTPKTLSRRTLLLESLFCSPKREERVLRYSVPR
jgi:hypothetical protein